MEAAIRVELEQFEGPLDLLLHLVRKNNISIEEIPIVQILDQYMAHLDQMQEFDIDVSGDFILMASELALIKSKLLLPLDTNETQAMNEGEDPRAALIKRLLEYQRYKDVAAAIEQRPLLERDVFVAHLQGVDLELEEQIQADLMKLSNAFAQLIARRPKKLKHEVVHVRLSVSERIYELMDFFKGRAQAAISFELLFEKDASRDAMIVTFLALLEMCRMKMMEVQQLDSLGQIQVMPLLDDGAEARPVIEDITFQ